MYLRVIAHDSTFRSQITLLNFQFSNHTSQLRSLLNIHISTVFISQLTLLNSKIENEDMKKKLKMKLNINGKLKG